MHEWHAVLHALASDPYDADALLTALRASPLDREFTNVSADNVDGAQILVADAHRVLAELAPTRRCYQGSLDTVASPDFAVRHSHVGGCAPWPTSTR
jgi:hypothetical protein